MVFPSWICMCGIKKDTTIFLSVIFNRAHALLCLYLVDQLVSLLPPGRCVVAGASFATSLGFVCEEFTWVLYTSLLWGGNSFL